MQEEHYQVMPPLSEEEFVALKAACAWVNFLTERHLWTEWGLGKMLLSRATQVVETLRGLNEREAGDLERACGLVWPAETFHFQVPTTEEQGK